METLALNSVSSSETINSEELLLRIETLEQKSKEMDESIRYAGRLQQSILPNELLFKNSFEDAFVYFQPKDVVSGDFYWIYLHGNDIYFAVGDCTGHGVPGALVNIAGNTALRQIIRTEGLSDPARILNLLNDEIVSLFNENLTDGARRDGMEIALCKFNLSSGTGQFCGAGRPLILIRDGELIEFKKGKSSIGYDEHGPKRFETIEFKLEKEDRYYIFSDGYTDQFGGENVKKFNRKRFRNLLLTIQDKTMDAQRKELSFAYNNWKGSQEQIDDVCVIGLKI
jgi:serine phosphatase RsbU (regulator of sigma subunit)